MSLREKIKRFIEGTAEAARDGQLDGADDTTDAILKAIEAESQAIRADERERLAKRFEDCGMEMYSGAQVAEEIRSQGEDK